MSLRLIENARAKSPGPYNLQEILSHLGADAALRMISSCPRYAPTPLRSLDRTARAAEVGAVWYKDESGRFGIGSFKALGGAYAVARLLQRLVSGAVRREVAIGELVRGPLRSMTEEITVTCATDGNHGRSVAAAAEVFGCRAAIFLHRDVSLGRENAIRAFGAEILRIDGDYDESVRACSRTAGENGLEIVSDTSWPGYREVPRDVMQGYTVMLIETLQQLAAARAAPLTHAFVQGGVGGLAAAVTAHLWEAAGSEAPIVAVVEPERADCLFQSALAGRPERASGDLSTIMADLSCGEVSIEAWRILERGARFFITIDDVPAIAAMRLLAHRGASALSIVTGESATAGLAALLATSKDPRPAPRACPRCRLQCPLDRQRRRDRSGALSRTGRRAGLRRSRDRRQRQTHGIPPMSATMTPEHKPRIAVIGGTGALGRALARRWAEAGYCVVIGSRDPAKARAAAAAITVPHGRPPLQGMAQAAAAAAAEVIVLTVPFAAHAATLEQIRPCCAGRIIVDAVVPLLPPKVGTAQIPPEGCAAVQASRTLGETATVVSAFHNVSAAKLNDTGPIDCDVLVFGDVRAARETVIRLAERAGLRALHGGPLANSIAAEAMTSVLITINRLYKVDGAGIRITGPGNDGGLG